MLYLQILLLSGCHIRPILECFHRCLEREPDLNSPSSPSSTDYPVMSFGFSVGDVVLLGQLAWKAVQNSQKACAEHDELTREVSSLHVVIRRLEKEAAKPESPLNRSGDHCKKELSVIVGGCEKVLKMLNRVLEKYNTLSERERSVKKLWQRVRFGNGDVADVRDLRAKMTHYTSALSLFVNMISMGSIGRVEQRMETAGGDIREIKSAVNSITAHLLSASNREGSVLTTYTDDDKAVWKEFRRELIAEGFSSSILKKHKRLIKDYINELGDRGLFDDEDPYGIEESSESAGTDVDSHTSPSTETQSPLRCYSTGLSKTMSSESADTDTDNHASPWTMPQSPLSYYPTGLSKTASINSRDNQFSAIENTVDHTPKGSPDTDFHEVLLCSSHFGPAFFRKFSFFVYKDADPLPYKTALLAGLPEDCLTVGRTDPFLLIARLQARLQILLECFPHVWVFRARKDIDEVRIWGAKTVGIDLDREVLVEIAESAHDMLVDFIGSRSCGVTNFAHILVKVLGVFYQHGLHSQRAPFTKIEELISSGLDIEKYARRGPTGELNAMSSELSNFLDLALIRQMGDWIRLFDTRIGTIPQRLASKWTKVAESITTSSHYPMTSLAIVLAEESYFIRRVQSIGEAVSLRRPTRRPSVSDLEMDHSSISISHENSSSGL